jgi:hypothetical protein
MTPTTRWACASGFSRGLAVDEVEVGSQPLTEALQCDRQRPLLAVVFGGVIANGSADPEQSGSRRRLLFCLHCRH